VQEKNLDEWVNRLTKENMPLFARTVQNVAGTAGRDDSSFAELAWSILQDPALTAQILKVCNSVYYNPSGERINTVSRAVMRLGFETIKEMCLSIALVETMVIGMHREKVAEEISRAFHAAVQSKALASGRKFVNPEEVFIAALLLRIGHIGFWCFAGEVGNQLELAMKDAEQEGQAEIEVLGFKLDWLTKRLSEEWKLSRFMGSVMHDRKANDLVARCVRLGHSIAQCAEKGWETPQIKKTIREVQDFLNVSEKEATAAVHESARIAAGITECYGAKLSSRLIPSPDGRVKKVEQVEQIAPEYPKTDHQVQMASVRDLSMLVINKKGDINTVLSILLEGIYRGIGMDRVIFALLTPDRGNLKGKYGLGWPSESFIEEFQLRLDGSNPNIFGYVLKNPEPNWVTDEPSHEIRALLTKEIYQFIGRDPFFIMPISVKGVAIGIVYADRNLSGRDLDEESFESFGFFGQQAHMALSALAHS
jgi:HD-like signal output (HDOD) protein